MHFHRATPGGVQVRVPGDRERVYSSGAHAQLLRVRRGHRDGGGRQREPPERR